MTGFKQSIPVAYSQVKLFFASVYVFSDNAEKQFLVDNAIYIKNGIPEKLQALLSCLSSCVISFIKNNQKIL